MNLFSNKIKYRKLVRGFTPTPTFKKYCSGFMPFLSFNKISSFNFYNRKLVSGFTLVEMLVAVALFSTAVVIGIGALYSAQQINTKLQATRVIMDSLNLSLEVMTRNMRYGSNFYCGTGSGDIISTSRHNCPYSISLDSNGHSIVFKPVDATLDIQRVAYYVDTNNHLIEQTLYHDGVTPDVIKQISSDDIIIDNLRFYVKGAELPPADTDQPMVTMILSGKTKDSKVLQKVTFVLQSSVTTRNTK